MYSSIAWKRRLREQQEWEGEDFGPVTWEELSNIRRNSVILFNSELYPNKISEWSLRTERNRENKCYICVLCRRLQDRARRLTPTVKVGPLARITVRNGRFLTHPDYPRTPHICDFDRNPMSDRAAVLARRAMIRARAEIYEDGMTPQDKISQVLKSFREDEKYSNLRNSSAEEIKQMEDIVLGRIHGRMWSESNSIRSLYGSRRKSVDFDQSEKTRKVYECPILGCDFLTYSPGMISVHLSEKHRAIDDSSTVQSANFEAKMDHYTVASEKNYEANGSFLSDSMPMRTPSSLIQSDSMKTAPNQIYESEGDYGPVIYEALSCQRRKSIILFESKRFPNKISEWALKMPANELTMYYTCVLCRSIKDKGKRQKPPVRYPPPARIVVRCGRFMVHPDYPKTPHICDFPNNPLADRDSVLSRRMLAKKPALSADLTVQNQKKLDQNPNYGYFVLHPTEDSSSDVYEAEKPCTWPEDLNISFSEGSDDDYETFTKINEQQNIDVESDELSSFQMQKSHTNIAIEKEKSSEIFCCSIVGCDFKAPTMIDLENHLREHELLDEQENFQYGNFESTGCSFGSSGAVGIYDETDLCGPFRKHPRIMEADHHFVLSTENNEVACNQDYFEKCDLPTDVSAPENLYDPDILRSSIQRHLQNIEGSLGNIGVLQLAEINEHLDRVWQGLCDIQLCNQPLSSLGADLIQNTAEPGQNGIAIP
ncbi:unnamed protein product [Thelazia callipaeda]|uniref:C2H2-type domain-containing protein n=1 Tax=Thelazia callipaeda TaxID=103827 RepID=A0A158RBQ6_THECL|nr:unnamed protein product [Thelazia callipaeda]